MRQCKSQTTPLGICVVSSSDSPVPPGRQRTGTTRVVTMSTSLDTVLQCEYHYSSVDSQTKHWLWSLNIHKRAQRFSFPSAFSSPYGLGDYHKVRLDCFFILMNTHFLLLGQNFNIIWWKRLSPKGILLAVRDTLRFEGDVQCRQNSAEKDNLFLFRQLMTFTWLILRENAKCWITELQHGPNKAQKSLKQQQEMVICC